MINTTARKAHDMSNVVEGVEQARAELDDGRHEAARSRRITTVPTVAERVKGRLRDMVEMLDSVGGMAGGAMGDTLGEMILIDPRRARAGLRVVVDFKDLQESHPRLAPHLLHLLFVDLIHRDPRHAEIRLSSLQEALEDERRLSSLWEALEDERRHADPEAGA
jgi:hypothetical protein